MAQLVMIAIIVFLFMVVVASSATEASISGRLNYNSVTGVCTLRGGYNPFVCENDDEEGIQRSILEDVKAALAESNINMHNLCVPRDKEDIESAIQDFSSLTGSHGNKGEVAWKFLRGIADSPTFVEKYWHKRPLLIRAIDTGGWVEGSFTLDRDIRLVDNSYIAGYKTAEILRNGTKTDTWEFGPLKANPIAKMTWNDVVEGLKGGTIYFNTAGSLWPTLGGLCRMTMYAFGLPSNVNVYVTPPHVTLSVPPHTDRQDVIVFQTEGSKRWRVFAPPPRAKGKDPMNRGKANDVLSFEEMGEPLIDTVLRKGDILYVPTGFPHTTDTSSVVDDADENVFQETSVHLTMGLDTHVWSLSMAHLRNTVLARCGKTVDLLVKEDLAYWNAMETIPLGFLGGDAWRRAVQQMGRNDVDGVISEEFKSRVIKDLRETLVLLEPERWIVNDGSNDKEGLPSDKDIGESIDFMVATHWASLLHNQDSLFKDIDPKSDETLIKAFHCSQEQNQIMEKFGKFSKNEAVERTFAQRRIAAEQRLKGVM